MQPNPIDPIIALTLRNTAVAVKLGAELDNGYLNYLMDEPEMRDAFLFPLWEAMQHDTHQLSFNYEQWCEALARVALPTRILDDIDSSLQSYEAMHAPNMVAYDQQKCELARSLLEDKNHGYSQDWKRMRSQAKEEKPGEIAALSNSIRNACKQIPNELKLKYGLGEDVLEERLQEMEQAIRGRFALTATTLATGQQIDGRD